MILRFCLYGFLKNQRYFEPFLYLALMEKGLSFLQIGLLIATREATTVCLEVPSGAIADHFGRRGSMILAFSAYCLCFAWLGYASHFLTFIPAMLLFAVGDAFRSGTHKAMIFTWLKRHGREAERTRVYGRTRSWSKLGSAVSGLVAAAFVFWTGHFSWVFYAACLPCLLSIMNICTYPSYLEGNAKKSGSLVDHLQESLAEIGNNGSLRRLIAESMGYEGLFAAIKDYLQPILKAFVLASVIGHMAGLSDKQATALLVGPVYLFLHLASAAASRNAHLWARRCGNETKGSGKLWMWQILLFALMSSAAWHEQWALLMLLFVSMHVLQNIWRPMLITRFDEQAPPEQGATLLSVESLAKRLATVIMAPLIGWLVDGPGEDPTLLPVALIGLLVSLAFYLSHPKQ